MNGRRAEDDGHRVERVPRPRQGIEGRARSLKFSEHRRQDPARDAVDVVHDDYDTVANIDADEWVNVVLTRSRAGRLRGYVDGTQVFDFTDPSAGKITDLNTLRFFRDNDNREESGGGVSRIRLYDNGMTPAQVAALGT